MQLEHAGWESVQEMGDAVDWEEALEGGGGLLAILWCYTRVPCIVDLCFCMFLFLFLLRTYHDLAWLHGMWNQIKIGNSLQHTGRLESQKGQIITSWLSDTNHTTTRTPRPFNLGFPTPSFLCSSTVSKKK